MSPALLDPTNPEIDVSNPLETVVYPYALSYQMAGTCRSALPIRTAQATTVSGTGGRCATIPDPTGGARTAQTYSNAHRGMPLVWALQHSPSVPPSDPQGSEEWPCWIQAIHPAEVQAPTRTYYFADSRDYRPSLGQWPSAGRYSGWDIGYGNQLFVGARHFGFANVLYLDGRVSRDEQMHQPQWVLSPGDPASGWRVASFQTSIRLANIRSQWPIMPVLRVRGWEYFFKGSGLTPR
jgi:prepilin-type processing-associated H-X9-DG protein